MLDFVLGTPTRLVFGRHSMDTAHFSYDALAATASFND